MKKSRESTIERTSAGRRVLFGTVGRLALAFSCTRERASLACFHSRLYYISLSLSLSLSLALAFTDDLINPRYER